MVNYGRIIILIALVVQFLPGLCLHALARGKGTAGIIGEVKNEVLIVTARGSAPAVKDGELKFEDILETGSNSRATLLVGGSKVTMTINEVSTLAPALFYEAPNYALTLGQMRASIREQARKILISAGDALITAGDADLDICLDQKQGHQLYVLRGRVWWNHQKFCTKKILGEGEFIIWDDEGIPRQPKEKAEEAKKKTEWM
jgi:hypothetical protein